MLAKAAQSMWKGRDMVAPTPGNAALAAIICTQECACVQVHMCVYVSNTGMWCLCLCVLALVFALRCQ